MDQRTSTLLGSALLIVGSIVVLLFALPSLGASVPVVVAVLAAVVMAAGTLLVGTSAGTV